MSVDIKGVEALKQGLRNLDSKLRKTILMKSFNKAAKPIIESAKNKIWMHQITGRVFRSLGTKAAKLKDLPMLLLGARTFGRFKGSYAHLLENGTVNRYYTTKNGIRKSTGKTRGIKFWENSINENQQTLQENLPNFIVLELEKEVNRIVKKLK